ncbi:catalase family peroxidase [Pseudomonas gingeri]
MNYHHRWRIAPLVVAIVCVGTLLFQARDFASTASSSSAPPTAAQMVDEFEASAGPHPGFRRNHAKGTCISGYFQGNGNVSELSLASAFRPGVVPVIGRLSIAGGNPTLNDARGDVRSLSLSLQTENGELWRLAMNSTPVFPVRTPRALFEQMQAFMPDKSTGHADPQKVEAFRQAHPEDRAFARWLVNHPPSSGFDNSTFYSVNAFHFIDRHQQVRAVRWAMVPESTYEPVSTEQAGGGDPDFLSYGLSTRLAQGPVRWHLIITLAEQGDPTDDATRQWPARRTHIEAGVLVIDKVESQVDGACRDVDFNPLMLPPGIEPSNDPLLLARGAAYAESHRRRLLEGGRVPATSDPAGARAVEHCENCAVNIYGSAE